MPIIFSSFKKSAEYPGVEKFSVARFQPEGYNFPALCFLAALDAEKQPIKMKSPRGAKNFPIEELGLFEANLRKGYASRWNWIKKWMDGLDNDKTIVLCCFCPYSNTGQHQLKKYGKFACHTGLIARMIAKHRPDIDLMFDEDRLYNMVEEWKR